MQKETGASQPRSAEQKIFTKYDDPSVLYSLRFTVHFTVLPCYFLITRKVTKMNWSVVQSKGNMENLWRYGCFVCHWQIIFSEGKYFTKKHYISKGKKKEETVVVV